MSLYVHSCNSHVITFFFTNGTSSYSVHTRRLHACDRRCTYHADTRSTICTRSLRKLFSWALQKHLKLFMCAYNDVGRQKHVHNHPLFLPSLVQYLPNDNTHITLALIAMRSQRARIPLNLPSCQPQTCLPQHNHHQRWIHAGSVGTPITATNNGERRQDRPWQPRRQRLRPPRGRQQRRRLPLLRRSWACWTRSRRP